MPDNKHPVNAASSNPQSTVGRTQWDALVDVVRLFGKGAPFLIVVGLALFGWWKFEDLSRQKERDLETARQQATQSYRQQLTEANERLIKTYESMGSISETQIKNLSQTLNLQQAATARAKELQNDLEKLTAEVTQHRGETEAARAERVQLTKELASIQTISAQLQAEVQKKQKELQDLDQNVKERQRSQKQVAEQISEIRKKMYELARAVREGSAISAQLAEAILKDAELTVSEGESLLSSMKDFIGRSENDLTHAIQIDDNVQFAVHATLEKETTAIFLAAQSLDNERVFRNVATFESDGARIVDARKFDFMAGVLLPRANDWFAVQPKLISLFGDQAQRDDLLAKDGVRDEWDLAQIDTGGGSHPSLRVIKGGGFKAKYLSVEEFDKLLPKPGTGGLEFEDGYLAFKRSLDFSAANVFPQSVGGVPSDLREMVIHFLDFLVKRRKEEAATLSAPSLVPIFGQIAAVALRPNFQFVAVSPPGSSAGASERPPNSITLIANYDRGNLPAKKDTASFRFSNGDNTGWKLDQFIPAAQVVAN